MHKKILFGLLLFSLLGCSPRESDSANSSGKMPPGGEITYGGIFTALTLSKITVNLFSMSSASIYEKVDSEWLEKTFYPQWRDRLWKEDNVTGWDGKFQCNAFAVKMLGDLQVRYYNERFQSAQKAEQLAIGLVFYSIGGDKTKGHAALVYIDAAGTVKGFEPQTGKSFLFTPAELATIQLKVI